MKEKVRTLLQKINFIETDMELQKQILYAIPSDQADEMEKVLVKIAGMKEEIQNLRHSIREIDLSEYNRILAMEQATETFKALAKEKNFVHVGTIDDSGPCRITLNDGTPIECLVAAKDDAGHWTLLSLDGEVLEYPGGLVRD